MLSTQLAAAEAPRLDYLFPAGGQQGAKVKVMAGGKLEPWPVSVWADDPGLAFRPGGTNAEFQVEIGPQAVPGPHWIRLYTAQGASSPRLFMVGQMAERLEEETIRGSANPTLIDTFPVVINGRIGKAGEVDAFTVRTDSSCTLRATVEAYRLDSPLDAGLVLLDESGKKLASGDNELARDPELSAALSQPGTFRLELTSASASAGRESGLEGSPAAVYRLTLIKQPFSPPAQPPVETATSQYGGEIQRAYQSAQQVSFPSTIHAQINPPGEEDRYVFEARANERFYFQARTTALGSPLVPRLEVLDASGSRVGQTESGADPRMTWVAPVDGTYYLAVADSQGSGGVGYYYELDLGVPMPQFACRVHVDALLVEPGGTNTLVVTVTKPAYYQGPLTLIFNDLPAFIAATPSAIPPHGGEVQVGFTAPTEAQPANGPFRMLLVAPLATGAQAVVAKTPITGRYASPGDLLTNDLEHVWLTVPPKADPGKSMR